MDTPNRFFGGEASDLGHAKQLPVRSWNQFVKEVLGHPALLNVSREQFRKMDPKQRNAAKRVRYVTPATFSSSGAGRITANARDIAILALDIDDPAQAIRLMKHEDSIENALAPLAFAAYTTASSTPDKPKLRVFVPADHLKVQHYPSAVRTIAKMLGLPTVTKESLVAVQPMYLPTVFRGDDSVDSHPLIAALTDGAVFTANLLTGDDAVPTMSTTGKKTQDTDDPSDGLEHIRAPLEGVTIADVQDALKAIDPDCSMADWITVGACIRHQFPKEPDEAFDLWNKWSSGGDKYDGEKAIAKRWKHINVTPKGRAPVTIRTLFRKATEAGWDGYEALNHRMYEDLAKWIEDKQRTEKDLMRIAVLRIARCGLTGLEKDGLMDKVRRALRAMDVKMNASALRKELQKMEKSIAKKMNPADAKNETSLPKWARGMCYVSGQNEFYHRNTDQHYPPEVLNRVFGRHLTLPDSEAGLPYIWPENFLLNDAKIPTVSNFLYDPTHPEETFVTYEGRRYVNTYLPTYPEGDEDSARQAQDVFEAHLENLIAEADYRRTLLDYLAYIVQNPGVKIRWVVLLQGAQGCGKTAIAEMMRYVLGPTNVQLLDASVLFTGFNDWAHGRQLVAMEEIRVVGHNRHEVMNRLKPCISNDTVVINKKHAALQQVPNNTNYLMFTNHHDSLAVTEEDRRYFVVNSKMQTKEDVKALGKAYFPNLFKCIEGNSGGLRYWLENHTISEDFQPNSHAPKTKYLSLLAGAAATPLTAAIKDALEDEVHPLARKDLVSTRCLKTVISNENLPRFSDQQLGVAMRELDYVMVGRYRIQEGERHTLWVKRKGGIPLNRVEKIAKARLEGKDPSQLL